MISVRHLSFSYGGSARAVLNDVSLSIEAGELVLLVGPSGGGKSTLLRCFNGLVPHFHGGTFAGSVTVAGRDTLQCQPRDLASFVGLVMQDPESQIVAEHVEDEIVFGLENLPLTTSGLEKRLEEALDAVNIVALRHRRLNTLSGGELQRVALASVLAMQPRVLLLDEPTSQLDPQAAEDLLATVHRLNDDLGITVIIAEHRLERVAQYADRVLHVDGRGHVESMETRTAMSMLPSAPPVSRLGAALGWSPLPLSVREGRRFVNVMAPLPPSTRGVSARCSETVIVIDRLSVAYAQERAIDDITLSVHAGEIVALMGRNGAGKTTLLRALIGLALAEDGTVRIAGHDTRETPTELLARDVAFVPQDPASVLFHDRVEEEIGATLSGTGRADGVPPAIEEWSLLALREQHPSDLSAGERQRAALAAMLAGRPEVILLDEPTRGMDHETKQLMIRNLRRRCAEGAAVVIASHDVELAAELADRVVLLAGGRIVVDGPVREVLTDTLTFSTQVNKLLGGTYLTPEDVMLPAQEVPA